MIKKISVFFVLTMLIACSSSDDGGSGGNGGTDNFDRAAMLTNWADNIIIPSYQSLLGKLNTLNTAADTFATTADQTNLDALRAAWLDAYRSWQHVEMFNIGRAEQIGYHFFMNVYPLNTTDVENNITNGGYDLTHVNNQDAQGFNAIDYLLYGVAATDNDIVAKFSSDTNAAAYRTYLTDITGRMVSLTEEVLNDWNGSYRSTFVSSDGNTVTSSVNKLVNDFIFYYEKGLRANKIGIPAGVFSATSLPDRVEAFYREDVSRILALDGLEAVQDFFNGKHFSSATTGQSLKSYLDYLNTIKNGEDLSGLINTQFNDARAKIQTLDANFVNQINTDNTQMTQAYDELQRAVVLIKVDMLQAFNISVDFVDADGD